MTRIKVCLIAAFVLLLCHSEVDGQQRRTMNSSDLGPKSTVIPAAGVDIPMRTRGSMPAFDVMVNGKGPYLFAMDTGAMGAGRADVSLAKELSLKPVDQITGSDGSGQGGRQMDVFQLQSIEFGGAKFTGLRAPGRDYNRSPLLERISGILGFHLFKDGLLTLDFENKRLRFEEGELPESDGKTVFDLVQNSPMPAIKLTLGNQELVFVLDTGNMGGISISKELADKLEFEGPLVLVGEARTVANRFEVREANLKESFSIGQHEFVKPVINVLDIPLTSNIGSQVLEKFQLTFDQNNHRVRFTRKGSKPIESKPKSRVGVAMGFRGETMTIQRVIPNSRAETAGLKQGDEVIRLNGLSVSNVKPEQIRGIMGSANPIRFEVKRNGPTQEIVVPPARTDESSDVQEKQKVKSSIGKVERSEVISEIATQLEKGYIFSDKGKKFANSIRSNLKKGNYAEIRDPADFAAQLTKDLQSVSNDAHLRVGYGTSRWSRSASNSGSPGTRRMVRRGSRSSPNGDSDYGFKDVRVMDDNVGYIEMSMFEGSDEAMTKADEAMTMLADVDALIIDLRNNRGGTERMVRHLSTYLFDKPTHLASTFRRGMDAPSERWTFDDVPGRRLSNVPVYILTSSGTASAAESFSFGLKINNRATLVGQRTRGAGHSGEMVSLPAGYEMFLPTGRTYDPKTGLGWEAEGIKPDVETDVENAVSVAHQLTQKKTCQEGK